MNPSPALWAFFPLLLLSLAGAPFSAAASKDGALPMVIEPGIATRGEAPPAWTVDLRRPESLDPRTVGERLSNRIYGAGPAELRQPLRFRTGFGRDVVFAFFLSRASRGGAALDVGLDGQFFARRGWMGGPQTHELNTLYYLHLPSGTREIELNCGNGVVVIDRYYFVNTIDELPEGMQMEEIEQEELPVAGGKDDGYRGIWFTLGQFAEYGDKYSGGLGTYTANHVPIAIYAPEVDKTFFVYGGTIRDRQHLLIMASYFDHENHRVPRPTIVHDKQGVTDPHDNPSIAIDGDGHIWVFISGRARGRPGFKYRSVEPYSVDEFYLVAEQEITYPQPWWVEGKGFIHMFTKYTAGRELYWETSPDGTRWSEDQKLAGIRGHYQISSHHKGKIGTFFNRHPGGSVDRRTDLYYVQSTDFGETWTTVDGRVLELPLSEEDNPARVINFEAEGRLQYTVDLNWDSDGHPVLLYVTSGGHQPGPASEPRFWQITRWTGSEWRTSIVCRSDHNYDLGGLYILDDRWMIFGPTAVGPQPWQTGGEMEIWESRDEGRTWTKARQVTVNSERNHKFARRPVEARDPFFAFWADGDPTEASISKLYFGESSGERYWELPYEMEGEFAEPRQVAGPAGRR